MHFNYSVTVFQLVCIFYSFIGELSLFPDWNKRNVKLLGQQSSKEKTTRFYTGNTVNRKVFQLLTKAVDNLLA
jgi:hypothetical protein